jgi:P63C domain-containing protein
MSKLPKATHEGKIQIGDTELNCAVLEDGTRVISASAIFRAFGRTKRGRAKSEMRVPNMPAFIDANNVQPFIGEDLKGVLNPINYIDKNGKSEVSGYSALILPKLCKVYLDAREAKVLKPQQKTLARASEILLIGLSNIGIIALVDEATGYQYDREKDELQKILKAYISEELLAWEKRFPDEFYREIFRLNHWDFTVSQIKAARPGIIGTWTKKYIYSVLPKGVLEALLNKTTRNEHGKLTQKLHQRLTREQGIEHLNKQIISAVTLMNISDSWKEFEKLWNKKFGQQELAFSDSKILEPTIELSSFNKNLKKALDFKPKED